MTIFVKEYNSIFEIAVSILKYLEENWDGGYNPNLEKIKFELHTSDQSIEDLFAATLSWLYDRALISYDLNSKEIARITKGERFDELLPLLCNYIKKSL